MNRKLAEAGNERDADGNLTNKARLARSADGAGAAQAMKRAKDEGGKKEAAKEGIKQGAAAAIEAKTGGAVNRRAARTGIEATGILTSKVKTAIKTMSLVPLAVVVLILALLGVTLSPQSVALNNGIYEHDDIELYIPQPTFLEALQEAAINEDVPWTVMAAITSLSTEAGKFSPYPDDLIDRDPDRDGIRRPNQGTVSGGGGGGMTLGGVDVGGDIPPMAAAAYINASQRVGEIVPGAVVPPELLAGVGWAESRHAQGPERIMANGDVEPPFVGPELDGSGVGGNRTPRPNNLTAQERIEFGVHGQWDQAIGPMQFLASTWKGGAKQDGNGDGQMNPHNFFDAALAAAVYLTRGEPVNLATDAEARRRGLRSYNNSGPYGESVQKKMAEYAPLFAAHANTAPTMPQTLDPSVAAPNGGGLDTQPLLPPSGVAGAGGVKIVGDSLCEPGVAADKLLELVSGVGVQASLDCVRSRALTGDGKAVAVRAAADASKLVVALGTNDTAAGFGAAIDEVVAAAGGREVIWVNVGTTQPGAAAVNAEIAAAVGRHPSLKVADFASVVAQRPELLAGDGVHLTVDGYTARAFVIAAALSGTSSGAGVPSSSMTYPPNPEGLEVAVFPEVTPPIGGDSDPGLGPYLLSRRAVSEADNLNPQRVALGRGSASTYLAKQLAAAAKSARSDGWDSVDTDTFWAEAVRRAPLVDPRQARGCKAPPITTGDAEATQQSVAAAINSLWRCEIAVAGAFYVLDRPNGKPLGAVEAASTVVDEALDVSWAFSQWGSAECDPNAEYAGVFPLSAEVYDEHSSDTADRCDPVSNITAAVRAFIAGESTQPGEQTGPTRGIGDRSTGPGEHNPMIGGWWAMPWALGNDAAVDAFLKDGPRSLAPIDNACKATLAAVAEQIEDNASRQDALDASDAASSCSAAEQEQIDAELDAVISERIRVLESDVPLYSGGVGDAPIDDVDTDAAPDGVDVDEFLQAELERIEAERAANPVVELTVEQRTERAQHLEQNLSDGSSSFEGGTSSSVRRLSHTGRGVPGRPALLVSTWQTVEDDYATWVIRMANAFGGTKIGSTFKGGDNPTSVILSFWGGGQATAQLGSDVPYAEQINTAAGGAGIDPRMLGAVARVRSKNFDEDLITCVVRSNSGESGILQMLPSTAADLGVEDPCVVESSLSGGAARLAALHDRFGDWGVALAAYHWGADNIEVNGRRNWPADTERFVAAVLDAYAEYKERFPDAGATIAIGQGAVGPEGCPTTAPPNTLRGGAEEIGVHELCRISIAEAPTPAAAQAIIQALSPGMLGTAYSMSALRMEPQIFDCSSYVSRAYYRAGYHTMLGNGSYAPVTGDYAGGGLPWTKEVPLAESLPGDIIWYPGHVTMKLGGGYMVHTNTRKDVAHVRRIYPDSQIKKTIRILPEVAGPARGVDPGLR